MNLHQKIALLRKRHQSGDVMACYELHGLLRAHLPVIVKRAARLPDDQSAIGRFVKRVFNRPIPRNDSTTRWPSPDDAEFIGRLSEALLQQQRPAGTAGHDKAKDTLRIREHHTIVHGV